MNAGRRAADILHGLDNRPNPQSDQQKTAQGGCSKHMAAMAWLGR
jgi:hypothetical protein